MLNYKIVCKILPNHCLYKAVNTWLCGVLKFPQKCQLQHKSQSLNKIQRLFSSYMYFVFCPLDKLNMLSWMDALIYQNCWLSVFSDNREMRKKVVGFHHFSPWTCGVLGLLNSSLCNSHASGWRLYLLLPLISPMFIIAISLTASCQSIIVNELQTTLVLDREILWASSRSFRKLHFQTKVY